MFKDKKIILVGCGKMGPAMLAGWISRGIDLASVVAVDPVAEETYGIVPLRSNDEIPEDFNPDFIVFAVKPDIIKSVCENYKRFKNKDVVFLSIAAGKDITILSSYLGKDTSIIRAMPNIPALISEAVTVAAANDNVTEEQKANATQLLEAIGMVYWVDNEDIMDAVTAISGSGPAYVFYFIECLINAAKELGLPEKLASPLAIQTVLGSAKLLYSSEESPESLREKVTSPNGTTAAALEVLMADNNLKKLISEATKAAERRAKELK